MELYLVRDMQGNKRVFCRCISIRKKMRDFDRLKKWDNKNLLYLSKRKSKVLHLGKDKPMHQCSHKLNTRNSLSMKIKLVFVVARVIKHWSRTPEWVVQSPSLEIFITRLNMALSNSSSCLCS